MQTKTNIYIIRHGEAWGAKTNVVSGMRGDEGLTPFGKEQAGRLRDRLAATREIVADVLLASTLPRARQTAEILQPAFGLEIGFDDDLQELRPGEADGLSQEEFRARYGEVDFWADPYRPVSPGGENFPEFVVRVGRTLHRINREHEGKTVVLVCHGGIVDASFYYFFGLNAQSLPQRAGFYTHNTSITHWGQEAMWDTNLRWRLFRYNDDVHLREGIRWPEVSPPEEGVQELSVPLPTED